MEGEFHWYSDSCATMQDDAVPGFESAVSFVSEMQELLGADFEPDPLFLEESWTLGMAVAMKNLKQRRQGQAERERQSREFRELNSLGSVSFMEASEQRANFLPAAFAAVVAQGYHSPQQAVTAAEAQTWRPQDWTPQDRTAQRWIPRGWTPQGWAPEPEDTAAEQRACRVLGVAAASSREQIKAAYRRRVRQWHPDRLEGTTDAVRQLANEQMATINEAYDILCSGVLADAQAA